MPAPRHLPNAPITEAIIDYRVKARHDFNPKRLDDLKRLLAARFPQVDERRGGRITFQFSPGGDQPAAMEDLGFQGYLFRAPDSKLLAQIGTDGLTLNRLKPYTSWEELSPIARELWNLYVDRAFPDSVTRLALRYINHVPLPPDLSDFATYLRAAPEVPPELPQSVSAFFVRTTIQDEGRGLAAHVTQALETDRALRKVTLILDIDAFSEGTWQPADPAIDQTFEALRDFKNHVFFNYLTDSTLRQFE